MKNVFSKVLKGPEYPLKENDATVEFLLLVKIDLIRLDSLCPLCPLANLCQTTGHSEVQFHDTQLLLFIATKRKPERDAYSNNPIRRGY